MIIGIDCNLKGKISFEDCNKCNIKCIPPFVLDFYLQNQSSYHKEHKQLSVSQLSGCLRKAYYDYVNDYYISQRLLITSVFGTLIHNGLHNYFTKKEGFLSEYKIEKCIKNFILTGTFDLYSSKTQTIYDFKVSDSFKPNWTTQLNIYRLLFDQPVSSLKIIMFTSERSIQIVPVKIVNVNVEERVDILGNALYNKAKLPQAEFSITCKWCNWINLCKKN